MTVRSGFCAPVPTSRSPRDEAGFTLLEIAILATLLVVGACALITVIVNSMTVSSTNRETSRAEKAGRRLLERIRGVPVGEVYASFNSDPADDPAGEGSAPGNLVLLEGAGAPNSSGVMVGEVIFPTDTNGGGGLREDVTDTQLGMPRDLNGDGAIDADDHSVDYLLLPVKVRVRWRGMAGLRSFELCTVLLNQ